MADDARRAVPGSPDGREALWAAVRAGLDDHPIEPGALGEYALVRQERGPAEAERAFPEVAAHLRGGCARCEADLRDFPFELETTAPFEGPRRLVATLLPPATSAAAARGAADPRVLIYAAGAASISISIFGGPPSYTLEGLVRSTGKAIAALAAGPARLRKPEGAVDTVAIDELGNFGFDALAAGVYELELRLGDDVLVVEELVIGPVAGQES
jgi:hypothetical protein